MKKIVRNLLAGAVLSLTAVISMANPLPLPQPLPQPPPPAGAKTFPQVHFVMEFDKDALGRHDKGLGSILEASFKAQLDRYYRQYNPPQRSFQFVEKLDPQSYDNMISGTYSVRAGRPGLLITVTIKDLHSGETQSFEAQGNAVQATERLAGAVFHEYQKTKFPTEIDLYGIKVRLIERSTLYRPGGSSMWEMYKQARLACEIHGGRLSTEQELSALGTLGDYAGGVSLGQNSVPTYYWAVDHNYVYMAQVSQSTQATDLNPQEYLNYVCVDLVPSSPPRPSR